MSGPPVLLLLLWLLRLLVSPAAAVCPAQCHCNRTSLTVSCERGGLEHFPIQLNPRVERLSLAGNRISRLHGSFDYYTGLVSLNLSGNTVDQLAALTFEHQSRLQELDLGDNLLERLPRGTLTGLSRLQRLSLAGNRLARLGEAAFREAAGLRRLDLSRNRLESLGGALSGLPRLAALNLCGNRLARVDGAELRTLGTVRDLRLCDNSMETLSGAAQLSGARRLDLSGNRLRSVTGLVGLTQLRRLDLSRNRLTALSDAAPGPALRRLDISANRLRWLSAADLAGLRQLQELWLCGSSELRGLAADALSGCPALHSLHLSNNSGLQRLPDGLLTASLRRVDLRGNSLAGVPAPAAAANLSWLDVRGNRLVCNCSLRWLRAAVADRRASDALCAGPGPLRGRRLSLLAVAELWCPPRLAPLALALGLPLLVLALAGAAFCALCRRRRRHKTATAGGCVAALAHSRGRKVAAPDGTDRERLRWPRYWPYEEAGGRRHQEEAATKLYSGHSEPSPDLCCAHQAPSLGAGPELKLVLSVDSYRDRAGYSSDDLYAASFASSERTVQPCPAPEHALTLRTPAAAAGSVPRPRRFSAAPAAATDTHGAARHSSYRREPCRPASAADVDLVRPRESRRRRPDAADPWRTPRQAAGRSTGSLFTAQTSDGVQYIPVGRL